MSGETASIDESVLSHEKEPPPPTRIILMRHAQSAANLPGGEGTVNAPLTKRGREQAKSFGEMMKEAGVSFDAVYTSGRDRSIATAEEITSILGEHIPLHTDKRLREKHDGTGNSDSIRDSSIKLRTTEASLPDSTRWSYTPDDPEFDLSTFETYEAVADRMQAAIDDIIANNPGSDILVVSHAMAMSSLIARYRLNDLWPDTREGSLFKNSVPNNTGYISFQGTPAETGVTIEMFDYDLNNQGDDLKEAMPDTT